MGQSRTPMRVLHLPQAIGENETDLQVGAVFPVTGDGMNLRIDFRVSDVTVAASITYKLQDSAIDDGSGTPLWRDVSGIAGSIAMDGLVTIVSGSSLASSGPLGSILRLLITTGAGDSLVVEEMRVLQAQ